MMKKHNFSMSPFRVQIIGIALLAIFISLLYYSNPLLYSNYEAIDSAVWKESFPDTSIYYHIQQSTVLDTILKEYQIYFLNDKEFMSYKNHCLRVLSLAMYYYYSISPEITTTTATTTTTRLDDNYDTTTVSIKQAIQHDIDIMAMALAYHDLALWVTLSTTTTTTTPPTDTEDTDDVLSTTTTYKTQQGILDYLNPSVELFLYDQSILHTKLVTEKENVIKTKEGNDATIDENINDIPIITSTVPIVSNVEQEMIIEMILQHHKITSWKKPTTSTTSSSSTSNNEGNNKIEVLVNAIRCSDWLDATMGIVRPFGCSISDSNNSYKSNNSTEETIHKLPTILQYMDYLYGQLYEYNFHTTLIDLTSRIYPQSYIQRLSILRILKW